MAKHGADSKKQSPDFGIALYYPYIHIQDEDWLKSALLYWDGIRRIVPPHYPPEDTKEVRNAVESGLVLDTDPVPYALGAEQRFRDLVMPLLREGSVVGNDDMFGGSRLALAHGFRFVHVDKMTYGLREDLRRRGLLADHGDWGYLSPELAGFYMMCLALEMSGRIQAPPVTDEMALEESGQYLLFDADRRKPIAPGAKTHGVMLSLGVPFPAPRDLHDVSLSRVITFNRKRADERRRFRLAVEEAITEVSKLDDRNAILDCLAQKGAEIRQAIADHRQAMAELRVTSVGSLCKISCPASFAAAAGYVATLSAEASVAFGAAGLTMGVANWVATSRAEKRKVIQSSPWHYLLSVERKFPVRR